MRELVATHAAIIDDAFFEKQNDRSVLFGDGADKCAALVKGQTIIAGIFPSASMMCASAFKQYEAGMFVDLAYFEPHYLKDFVPGVPKKNPLL